MEECTCQSTLSFTHACWSQQSTHMYVLAIVYCSSLLMLLQHHYSDICFMCMSTICHLQTVGGYRRAPESQEQIRHHAIQLGIDTFLSNLSEAITDLLSHNINSRHCEESHTASASSSKSAPRSKHRRCRSETSFPSSRRREGHSPHSGSMSDTESKGSDGSEHTTRHKCINQQASSSLSPGMRYRRSWSSAHSSLPTIAQSPPENQIPCGGSSAETMSLYDNSQPNANGDDCQSLPFSSQPTVSATNM